MFWNSSAITSFSLLKLNLKNNVIINCHLHLKSIFVRMKCLYPGKDIPESVPQKLLLDTFRKKEKKNNKNKSKYYC